MRKEKRKAWEQKKIIWKGIQDVSNASTFAQYDAYAKKILSHKIFLSHILKGTIQEFKDMDPADIVPYWKSHLEQTVNYIIC